MAAEVEGIFSSSYTELHSNLLALAVVHSSPLHLSKCFFDWFYQKIQKENTVGYGN